MLVKSWAVVGFVPAESRLSHVLLTMGYLGELLWANQAERKGGQETEVKMGGQLFWSCFFAKFLQICWVLSCGLLS